MSETMSGSVNTDMVDLYCWPPNCYHCHRRNRDWMLSAWYPYRMPNEFAVVGHVQSNDGPNVNVAAVVVTADGDDDDGDADDH